jgi:hypothetical protein
MLVCQELRGFDNLRIAVTLNGFEVQPVLGNHSCFPTPRANCYLDIQRHSLRRAGMKPFQLTSVTSPTILAQQVQDFAARSQSVSLGIIKELSSLY